MNAFEWLKYLQREDKLKSILSTEDNVVTNVVTVDYNVACGYNNVACGYNNVAIGYSTLGQTDSQQISREKRISREKKLKRIFSGK